MESVLPLFLYMGYGGGGGTDFVISLALWLVTFKTTSTGPKAERTSAEN